MIKEDGSEAKQTKGFVGLALFEAKLVCVIVKGITTHKLRGEGFLTVVSPPGSCESFFPSLQGFIGFLNFEIRNTKTFKK